jgi:LysM repeat protein
MLAQPTSKCIICPMEISETSRIGFHLPIVVILLLIGLYGCTNAAQTGNPVLSEEGVIIAYATATASQTPEIPQTKLSESINPTPIPSPTPTPFLYTIVKNDTFTSIAYRHGVKVNDLITANPGVDPNFLSIGITITIPITGTSSTLFPDPTPIPLVLQNPACYTITDGGQWCLALVENTQAYDVENIAARIYLQTPNQDADIISQAALSPLNRLSKGQSIPLVAYFPPPIPFIFQPQINLVTVLPIDTDNRRYIDLVLNVTSVSISNNKLQATVLGDVSLSLENQVAQQVWIVAIAYDKDGKPVGIRKQESNATFTSGGKFLFEINVYSLGPPIETIDVTYEARP